MSEVPSVVVVDHYDSYTWNLVHLIAEITGRLPEVVEHDGTSRSALQQHTHVVLSPGPGTPIDPDDFALGRSVFELGLPVLGVCLGMQALVTAFGGTVAPIEPAHGEVATISHDSSLLFDGVPTPFEAVRYHSLAATTVPAQLRITAQLTAPTANDNDVVMGVAHADLPLFGVQFHPESILSQHGHRLLANFLAVR